MAERQCLVLKAQKVQAFYERKAKLHQEETEDALNQPKDQQQCLSDVLLLLPVSPIVSNLQCKKGNKSLLEQLVLGELTLWKKTCFHP